MTAIKCNKVALAQVTATALQPGMPVNPVDLGGSGSYINGVSSDEEAVYSIPNCSSAQFVLHSRQTWKYRTHM